MCNFLLTIYYLVFEKNHEKLHCELLPGFFMIASSYNVINPVLSNFTVSPYLQPGIEDRSDVSPSILTVTTIAPLHGPKLQAQSFSEQVND